MRLKLAMAAVAAALAAAGAAAQPSEGRPWAAQGRLEQADQHGSAEDPEYYDEHRIRLEAGRRYRISASSADFDTVIRLSQAGETGLVAMNDDFGESLDSRITYTPEETDDYILTVQPFDRESLGAYEVRVEALPPLPPPIAGRPTGRAETRWEIWEGELAATDPDRDGGYFDDYLIRVRAGETRLISAESEVLDPTIMVLRNDAREGEPLDLDEYAGPWDNALLGFQPEDDGEYLVRVTAGNGTTGRYRLRISDPLTPPPPGPPAAPSAASGD